jgi:protocatechuate 3,4-dioxygenase beta subunit
MTATATQVDLKPTPAQIEGPYWLPGSPERHRIRDEETKGEPITITGRVTNVRGVPIPGCWIDFWQANGEAQYDIFGYRLRGHQWTDEEGRYRLETVIPSEYDDDLTDADGRTTRVYRTAHIHVKVKPPRRQMINTQLYFPGLPGNKRDGFCLDDLLLEIVETPTGKEGHFDFVVV